MENKEFIIREGLRSDIPEIIELMRSSLGEKLMPKSEAFFKWKHLQNPFGPSEILLAVHEERIVGLRTFMYWQWEKNQESISAVRAVDTATAADFQGKGIFKTLTLRAVEVCKTKGVSIVFNTPNPVSKQGYLKMGWQEAGRMPFYVAPGSLFPRRFQSGLQGRIDDNFAVRNCLSAFTKGWQLRLNATCYHTPVSTSYIQWRYADCPVAAYGMMGEPDKFGIIFRIKNLKGFIELRICECWCLPGGRNLKLFRQSYQHILKNLRPLMVTAAPSVQLGFSEKPSSLMLGPFRKGPMVTVRSLAMENLKEFDNFQSWRPSIGSLELF